MPQNIVLYLQNENISSKILEKSNFYHIHTFENVLIWCRSLIKKGKQTKKQNICLHIKQGVVVPVLVNLQFIIL